MSPLTVTLRFAWSRRGLALWVGALGVIVTVTTCAVLMRRDRILEQTRFGMLGRERIAAIETEIERPIRCLSVAASSRDSDDSDEVFVSQRFATALMGEFPQVLSVGWLPSNGLDGSTNSSWPADSESSLSNWRVDNLGARDRDASARRMRVFCAANHQPSFDRTNAFRLPTVTDGSEPVSEIVEPDNRLILVTEPVFVSRVANTTDSHTSDSHISDSHISDSHISDSHISDSRATPEVIDRGELIGWIVMEIDLQVASALALDRMAPTPVEFALVPRSASADQPNSESAGQFYDLAPGWVQGDQIRSEFKIAQQPWVLVATTPRGSLLDVGRESPWPTLLAGLFASLSLAAYVASLVSRSEKIQQLVVQRTRELHDTNEQLQSENESRRIAEERATRHALALQTANEQLEAIRQSMAEALVELEHRNQELDEFNYIASHDLQEPVRKLISFTTLLKQDMGKDLPDNASQDLHYIVDAALRMRQLINDLLAFSKAGRAAMRMEPVDLNECLRIAQDSLMLQIEERQADIRINALPWVEGDPVLLTQMLQNLLSNAIKFCDEKTPIVEVGYETEGDSCVLWIRDNGIGIRPKYAERIFQPFQRLHGRNKYEGNGIGLAICRKTVVRHRGKIWVESEPGHGAKFFISLPGIEKPRSIDEADSESSEALLV